MMPPWRLACAARGLTPRWAATVAVTWLSVLAFSAVTLPIKFPYDMAGTVVDTGLVVGLAVPVAAMARTLDEGALYLVQTASRALSASRLAWAAGLLALTAALAAALAAPLPVPVLLTVGDALLFAGLALLGAGLIGGDLAWVPPVTVAMAASAPGVAPLEVNILYHYERAGTTLAVALAVAVLGTAVYARRGPAGPQRRARAWRVDAQAGDE